jgi:hypothetical protein
VKALEQHQPYRPQVKGSMHVAASWEKESDDLKPEENNDNNNRNKNINGEERTVRYDCIFIFYARRKSSMQCTCVLTSPVETG